MFQQMYIMSQIIWEVLLFVIGNLHVYAWSESCDLGKIAMYIKAQALVEEQVTSFVLLSASQGILLDCLYLSIDGPDKQTILRIKGCLM